MPNFGELEDEATSHSKEANEGIEKLDQAADNEAGGKDHGLIDKGAQEAEKELGGSEQGSTADEDKQS